MKYWDQSFNDWKGISNTSAGLYDARGYMIFIRGDRSVDGVNNTAANPTTLRAKGPLTTGNKSFTLPASSTTFVSLGNPYASAVDMRKVLFQTGDTLGFFFVWNASMGGNYGYGIYETYLFDGNNYISIPANNQNNYIESGQAFFVQTNATPSTLVFSEQSKATPGGSSITYYRTQGSSGKMSQLRTNLYSVNADAGTTLN